MHMLLHLVPRHMVSRAVRAEHRAGGVVRIAVGIIAAGGKHRLGVVAGGVAAQRAGQAAAASGIGGHLGGIAAHLRDGGIARKQGGGALRLRRRKASAHALDIGNGAAKVFGGGLQPKIVPWLQQDAFGFFQPLAHGPPGRLPKIAALGVLLMRAPGHQRNFHIRDRRAHQHAPVLLFGKVR